MWPRLARRDLNLALAVACLGGFWYFLREIDPQPRWLRWATWW